MMQLLGILLLAWIGWIGNPPKNHAAVHYERIGNAISPEEGKRLFTEITEVEVQEYARIVRSQYSYNEHVFATKQLSWSAFQKYPTYEYKNDQTGEAEEVKPVESGLLVRYKTSADGWKEKILPHKPNYAYDEGLVESVKNNWSDLHAGKTLSLAVVVPHRLDYYHFSVQAKALTKGIVAVTIAPENFFLKQVVNPITMTFNNERKLISITGVTNVNYSETGTQPVQISYTGKRTI